MKPHGHKRGSKGLAGGYGGYRKRKNWGYERTGPLETQRERDVREARIADFIARGGTIKRYELAIVRGAMPVQRGETFIERACREAELLEELRASGPESRG